MFIGNIANGVPCPLWKTARTILPLHLWESVQRKRRGRSSGMRRRQILERHVCLKLPKYKYCYCLPKYTTTTYISAGWVSPPQLAFCKTGKNPRHPYSGISEASATKMTSILRLLYANRLWKYGQASDPRIPAEGVITPININEDGGMNNVVFANKMAVDVMVVNPDDWFKYKKSPEEPESWPSERRNQAARYRKVCWSFLISVHLNMPPSRFQAAKICPLSFHFWPGTTSVEESAVPAGSQAAAGSEKTAHQTPESPMASRRENVEPFSLVTGIRATINSIIPAKYPKAIPLEEICEVAFVNALE